MGRLRTAGELLSALVGGNHLTDYVTVARDLTSEAFDRTGHLVYLTTTT